MYNLPDYVINGCTYPEKFESTKGVCGSHNSEWDVQTIQWVTENRQRD